MKLSNDSIEHALFVLGKSYQEGPPDYASAIHAYDTLLLQFPNTRVREEVLFNLYYCYKKTGDEANATRVFNELKEKYPSGKFTTLLTSPNSINYGDNIAKEDATKRYEKIYTAFIEGRFDDALAEKKAADNMYGDKYWTPQLLYIEAVFFIRQRQDSAAKATLNSIVQKYAGTPMAEKAKTFLEVLGRRKQIEDYLTKLQIERASDSETVTTDSAVAVKPRLVRQDDKLIYVQPKKDSSVVTPVVKDSSNAVAKVKSKTDTIRVNKPAITEKSAFTFTPDKPHSVAIFLNKVDQVYVTETKNAFDRYNRETYYNKQMDINNVSLNDTLKLVVISGFDNATAAMDYLEKARKSAPREIVPWLPAGKYSFLIVTDQNLEILKVNKDVPAYLKFLSGNFPGHF